jgi:hypothetical protein
MSKKRKDATPPQESDTSEPPQPTIHEAELASGSSGGVEYGPEIDQAAAVARRQEGMWWFGVTISGPTGLSQDPSRRRWALTSNPHRTTRLARRHSHTFSRSHGHPRATASTKRSAVRRGGSDEILHSRIDCSGAVR